MFPNAFTKEPIPKDIPKDMEQRIRLLLSKSKNKEDFLKKTFIAKYKVNRPSTWLEFSLLFNTEVRNKY